ncbi:MULTISPECIES: zinc-binding alcohol dehydrogenase family protein [unclassified Lacticaseibacillus]|uniref:zinc-binding alcohol dehydrogenase family protein n=1 Tax=unclassified Lacticaseibacillus TaxID=2759744 RepID=UPI001942AC97|nr:MULTISPECIES: zinc-binding alcohol dehydrogenase family protein [unclassified Lacticaseibacillus]
MFENLGFAAYDGLALDDPTSLVPIDLKRPSAGANDVVVQVRAIALNPVDEKQRAALAKQTQPRILGYDACGTIAAVGSRVTRFKPGERVMYAGTTKRPGSFQQFQAVSADLIAAAPANLTAGEAAALPLVGLTAWELLFEKMHFTPAADANRGKTLLIINGAGGVGSMLSQLAHWTGMTVLATASPRHFDWLTQHGTAVPLDYHDDLIGAVHQAGYPIVDAVAILYATEPYLGLAAQLVAPFGHVGALATPQGPLEVTALKGKAASLDFEFMFAKSDYHHDMASQGHILSQLATLASVGLLDPSVTTRYDRITIANIKAGLATLMAGHQTGKIVLDGPFEG